MTLDVEGVVDRRMGDEEALGRGLGFEQLLLAFSSSNREVRVLDPVVLAEPSRAMDVPEIQLI